jgi:hypothetical protein
MGRRVCSLVSPISLVKNMSFAKLSLPSNEHVDLQTMLNKLRVYAERKSVWLTSSIFNGLLLRLPVSTY